MPTYLYKCPNCGYEQDYSLGINELKEFVCPLCKKALKKHITAPNGFILKGAGFYRNDYKTEEEL